MVRAFYTLIFTLIQPIVCMRLFWRSIKAPAYRHRMLERYGLYFNYRLNNKPTIWVHAVSVGETIAAVPMVRELQLRYPDCSLLVTTTTPTGSQQVRKLFRGSVEHVYAPYDLPLCLAGFFARYQPVIAIVMETELWPNMVAACARRHIPLVVANARLSERSAKGYEKFSPLTRPMFERLSCVVAQNDTDAQRFIDVGVKPQNLIVSGSIKFDIAIDDATRTKSVELYKRWHAYHSTVIIAASTHEGEDEMLIRAFNTLRSEHADILLVLVPRHPERFNSVAKLALDYGLVISRRSNKDLVTAETNVVIADTMGEMMTLLGGSDIAFVGGSLVPHGGHNVLEPALWQLPVVSGQHMFNFLQISELLAAEGGLAKVDDEIELTHQLNHMLLDDDYRKIMGRQAYKVVEENKGALVKLLDAIGSQIKLKH